MAGSGVYRTRMSTKNHSMPIQNQSQRKGRFGAAPVRGEVLRVPKKPAAAVFKTLPTTKPPESNIAPVRGEGPTRNVNK